MLGKIITLEFRVIALLSQEVYLYTRGMFLDEVKITVQGGRGGNGCVAWRREKYVPLGGPDGGDGGDGGNVVVLADANTDTLSAFGSRKNFTAKPGEPGRGKSCAGANGPDLVLRVPPGTTVHTLSDSGVKQFLVDLTKTNESFIVARGGRGGYGNAHFVSSTRQAPDFAELGERGVEVTLLLELKLVADVGIIGYPSVGKSSLIASVSKARPKIADYPFTTLVPNLGVATVSGREMVLCDVPGLIEGASEGKGLGHTFLRHIERCAILLHLLDISRDDIIADYRSIRRELEKYSPTLAAKPEYVVLSKSDLVSGDTAGWKSLLKKAKIKHFCDVSAATHQGTEEMLQKLLPLVLAQREGRELAAESESKGDALPVLQPHKDARSQMSDFSIVREGEKVIITGKRLQQFTEMTNFSQASGKQRFLDVLRRCGVIRELEKIVTPEDEIYIGAMRIDEHLRV